MSLVNAGEADWGPNARDKIRFIVPAGLYLNRIEPIKRQLGIIRGNPGVFQLYPYPTLQKPLPLMRVRVSENPRVCLITKGIHPI